MFKMKKTIIKKVITACFLVVFIILTIVSCGMFIDGIDIAQVDENGKEVYYAKAGSEIHFTVRGHAECNTTDDKGITGKMIFAMLVPKDWDFANTATVTYKNDLADNPEEQMTMSVVPNTSLPKNGNGKTWAQCLTSTYGVGPNVLDDMEWVVFQTDRTWNILNNQNPTFTIYIKAKAGSKNLRCKLGFFVDDTDDGFSTDERRFKVSYSTECFEIVGGRGMTIDFCNQHFNKTTPLTSLQNDFITISFVRDVAQNDLSSENQIYLLGEAVTKSGRVYAISNRDANTLMSRTSSVSSTFSKTIWPMSYFGVPDGEELDHINYYFSNADGTVSVTQSDDDFVQEGTPLPVTKTPFEFKFSCE